MTPGSWSRHYARFLSWKHGREVMSPFAGVGAKFETHYSEDMEQRPMRFADTGARVAVPTAMEPDDGP